MIKLYIGFSARSSRTPLSFVTAEYVDHGDSGANGREHRPAFHRMRKAPAQGKIDLIPAGSVDQLGRSLQDLVVFFSEFQATRVDLYLHRGRDQYRHSGR